MTGASGKGREPLEGVSSSSSGSSQCPRARVCYLVGSSGGCPKVAGEREENRRPERRDEWDGSWSREGGEGGLVRSTRDCRDKLRVCHWQPTVSPPRYQSRRLILIGCHMHASSLVASCIVELRMSLLTAPSDPPASPTAVSGSAVPAPVPYQQRAGYISPTSSAVQTG